MPNIDFTRRKFLTGTAVGICAAASMTENLLAQQSQRTFVLVHGAWRGGWVWRRVADRLEKLGHKVYTPTLTGLADRSHLLDAKVNLTTHINDIANLIKWERLENITLCGHSYGGFVVSGVAEKAGDKIASIVFADAFVPDNGENLSDQVPRIFDQIATLKPQGKIAMPAGPSKFFSSTIKKEDAAWVDPLYTEQPIAPFEEKIVLTGARERIARKSYIRALGFSTPPFDKALARAKAEKWQVHELPCGHDLMVEMPDETTQYLIQA